MLRSGFTKARGSIGRPAAVMMAVCLGLVTVLEMDRAQGAEHMAPAEPASRAHLEDGKAALDDGAFDLAVLQFERAITTDPRNARAFAWLGYAHGEAGRPEMARKYYRLALDIDPGEIKALFWNGQMDVESQDLEAARAKLARMARACAGQCEEYRTLEHSIRMLTARLEQR
jgi:Flp pilus assembly protein TadD